MKKALLWIGSLIGVILLIVITIFLTAHFNYHSKKDTVYEFQPDLISLPTNIVDLEEGKRIYFSRGCADCHGADLGGHIIIDETAVGVMAGSNLTSGQYGVIKNYDTRSLIRAIRHGIKYDGKPVYFMPSNEFNLMSNTDLSKLIAFILSAPASENQPPASFPGPLMKILYLMGEVQLHSASIIDHTNERGEEIPVGATIEYGQYLSSTCIGCHGSGFSGGKIPGAPPSIPLATNITPHASGLSRYTAETFQRALREGLNAEGNKINPFMPYQNFRLLTDDEIQALWLYLHTVPIKETGNR